VPPPESQCRRCSPHLGIHQRGRAGILTELADRIIAGRGRADAFLSMCSETHREDFARLVVPDVGRLISAGSEAEPYRLLDASGDAIGTATLFFEELYACDRSSAATIRSYGHDLVRCGVFSQQSTWEGRATPTEGRDFARWMKIADKPRREHCRRRGERVSGTTPVGGNAVSSGQRGHRQAALTCTYGVNTLSQQENRPTPLA
jgi:hypothetical protein